MYLAKNLRNWIFQLFLVLVSAGSIFLCFHSCRDIAKWRAWSQANHTTLKHKNKFELKVN